MGNWDPHRSVPLTSRRWLSDSVRALFGRSSRTGAALLGEKHPLVRALDLLGVVTRQSLVVAIVIVLGGLGVAQHSAQALAVLVAAAVVEFALGAAIALLVQLKRERARDLIIEGHEDLPLPCVAAERERLLDPREQRRLARALERLLRAAENYEQLLITSRPPPGTRRLREVAPELREIAADLRAEQVGVRGVARVTRLLTGGYASPFYTGRIGEVQFELDRIRSESPSDARPQERSDRSPQQKKPPRPANRASRSQSSQRVSDEGAGKPDRARQRRLSR
jgi:hypothetical protein